MIVHYEMRLEFRDGTESIINDVEEYEPGFRYLFVRCYSGTTLSFDRMDLWQAWRRTSPDRNWIPIALRKPKRKPTYSEASRGFN
jgi:hypothetical protein